MTVGMTVVKKDVNENQDILSFVYKEVLDYPTTLYYSETPHFSHKLPIELYSTSKKMLQSVSINSITCEVDEMVFKQVKYWKAHFIGIMRWLLED